MSDVTFDAWLASPALNDDGSLDPKETVAQVLERLWRRNGGKFSREGYDYLGPGESLTVAEALRLSHLLGIMDCFGFLEAGRMPPAAGEHFPPKMRATINKLVEGWMTTGHDAGKGSST